MVTSSHPPGRGRDDAGRRSPGEIIARVVAAAGLACDAYVHFDLAGVFDANVAVISQGVLFRAEGVGAAIAAILVLLTRSRAAAVLAVLVAGSALAAVVVFRYADLGPLGPLPDMYEPIWYPEKIFSAIGEAVAFLAASSVALTSMRKGPPRVATSSHRRS